MEELISIWESVLFYYCSEYTANDNENYWIMFVYTKKIKKKRKNFQKGVDTKKRLWYYN